MPLLQMSNIKVRRIDEPFEDGKLGSVMLHLSYGWAEKYYWWFFADNPHYLEWRCVGTDIQIKIEDQWTDTIFLGSENSEWVHISRTSDYADAYIKILNGRVVDTCFAIWDRDDSASDWGMLHTEYNTLIRQSEKGRGCAKMPDFTETQRQMLRKKIGDRYLLAAKKWFEDRDRDAKDEMEYNASRLKELGFDPPEHDFSTPEPLVVPIFKHDGAFFVTDPIKSHEDNEEDECGCAYCAHDEEEYKDDDSCGCTNCCDNQDHWYTHNRNPDHCNFCKEFAKHIGHAVEED